MEVSRGGNSSWHGEEVLSPNGSHRHRPAHLWRRHGSTRRGEKGFSIVLLCGRSTSEDLRTCTRSQENLALNPSRGFVKKFVFFNTVRIKEDKLDIWRSRKDLNPQSLCYQRLLSPPNQYKHSDRQQVDTFNSNKCSSSWKISKNLWICPILQCILKMGLHQEQISSKNQLVPLSPVTIFVNIRGSANPMCCCNL